jgi:hypothetical protein
MRQVSGAPWHPLPNFCCIMFFHDMARPTRSRITNTSLTQGKSAATRAAISSPYCA